MVTTTDDLSERMTAVETGLVELRGEMQANQRETNARLTAVEHSVLEVRGDLQETNARLTAVETAVSELREDQRATNGLIVSLQQSMDARIDGVTARIDALQQSVNSRIDRLFYAIVGGSAAMVIATVSALLTLVLTLD